MHQLWDTGTLNPLPTPPLHHPLHHSYTTLYTTPNQFKGYIHSRVVQSMGVQYRRRVI